MIYVHASQFIIRTTVVIVQIFGTNINIVVVRSFSSFLLLLSLLLHYTGDVSKKGV